MAESIVEDEKIPIAAAAREFGEPERSLFRAVEQGKVPSTVRDGVRVVSRPDLRAWAERRNAARAGATANPLPTSAAGDDPTATAMPSAHVGVAVAARAVGSGSPPVLDGEQAAPLFAAFDQGESPADLVQRLRIPPAIALAAWREYNALQGAAGAKNPLADRVTALEALAEDLRLQVENLTMGTWIPSPMRDLQATVETIGQVLRELPVPARSMFTCQCGAHAYVESLIRCTACGTQTSSPGSSRGARAPPWTQ